MTAKRYRQVACFLTPAQHEALKRLSARTRVPMQAYLRECVDLLLKKYKEKRS
jgi:hypothetical protein